jgi:PiT family inorganic phosphate transporter
LIGGLVGAGTAKVGVSAIVWTGLAKTSAAIVLSPFSGFVLAMLLFLLVSWLFARYTPFAVDRLFRSLQFVSASLYSLGHSGNDAQKTMGIIAVLLYSQDYLGGVFHVDDHTICGPSIEYPLHHGSIAVGGGHYALP